MAQPAYASPDENAKVEISHLLEFVRATKCQYERNGDFHKGPAAAKHIQKKYDYYVKDIETAEDFIALSASRSTMSKRRYKIHCAGEPAIFSQQFLLAELQRFRVTQAQISLGKTD